MKTSYQKKHPHLFGVLKLEGIPGTGMCIHRSAAFVLDVPGSEMIVAVCSPATEADLKKNPLASTEPFIHAWAEYKNSVFAPTHLEPTGVKLVPKSVYYHYQQPTVVRRISRPEVLKISGQIGLSAHLRKAVPPKASVGETFLNHVGIAWTISADGGLIPA